MGEHFPQLPFAFPKHKVANKTDLVVIQTVAVDLCHG